MRALKKFVAAMICLPKSAIHGRIPHDSHTVLHELDGADTSPQGDICVSRGREPARCRCRRHSSRVAATPTLFALIGVSAETPHRIPLFQNGYPLLVITPNLKDNHSLSLLPAAP